MKIEIHQHPRVAHFTIKDVRYDTADDNADDLIKALELLFNHPDYHYADKPRAWRLQFRVSTVLVNTLNAQEFTHNLLDAFNSFDRFVSAEHGLIRQTKVGKGMKVCIDVVCVQPRRMTGGEDIGFREPFDPVAHMNAVLGGDE